MKTKIAIAVVFLTLLGIGFSACTPHTDYFEPFRGSFTAEVEGELGGEVKPERRRLWLSSASCTVKEITPFFERGVTLLMVPSNFSLPIFTIALPPAATLSP